jgi:hypothetical protein
MMTSSSLQHAQPGINRNNNNNNNMMMHQQQQQQQPPQYHQRQQQPHYGGSGGGGPKICKFFLSPAGCRFGASCRFAHA